MISTLLGILQFSTNQDEICQSSFQNIAESLKKETTHKHYRSVLIFTVPPKLELVLNYFLDKNTLKL